MDKAFIYEFCRLFVYFAVFSSVVNNFICKGGEDKLLIRNFFEEVIL